jgi:hypothetical protein
MPVQRILLLFQLLLQRIICQLIYQICERRNARRILIENFLKTFFIFDSLMSTTLYLLPFREAEIKRKLRILMGRSVVRRSLEASRSRCEDNNKTYTRQTVMLWTWLNFIKFEVFTAVKISIIFWVVTPCGPAGGYRLFRRKLLP